jgi:hypothetical protein
MIIFYFFKPGKEKNLKAIKVHQCLEKSSANERYFWWSEDAVNPG